MANIMTAWKRRTRWRSHNFVLRLELFKIKGKAFQV